ncbi:two-component system QseEF-associated lipoprotein QseG [Erwinia sp. Leaf53]|uniref:two-component system QseEF-associated lipoprotein QseG n=1 Tax=Erwinia sp. Leaf53 TaxID=1736225 RepID=UPI00070076FD|nr:two-component system QseEF-associated lipoprotein QseG [Erwinia sp. Leaf53]KQN54878.1 hypothetical protein ASF13_10550 [Erwinia sp. Leaf53]
MRLTLSLFQLPSLRHGAVCAVALLSGLLAGCNTPSRSGADAIHTGSPPESTLVDYHQVGCASIWSFNDTAAMHNPLYWLRAMDCAERLSPAAARAEAHRWPAENWQSTFKQAVLLDNGNVTPVERRQYLDRLDGYGSDYPAAVRPLLTLWREGQGSLLQLSAERTRYAHLQQSSDAQLDALRQQASSQSQQLADTRRKLDSLTDIERQLSSRRAPDAGDTSHADDRAEPAGSPRPGNPTGEDANP